MNLIEFQKDPRLIEQYMTWIKSDIGILVCSVLQDTFCRPILPGQIGEHMNRSTSEFCLGENAGSWKMLDAICHLDNLAVQAEKQPTEIYKDRSEYREEV